MENDTSTAYYNPYQAKSDCNRTMIYCIVSIGLLIASGALTHPDVIAALPGGVATSSILSLLVIISVLLLCFWQRPRSNRGIYDNESASLETV